MKQLEIVTSKTNLEKQAWNARNAGCTTRMYIAHYEYPVTVILIIRFSSYFLLSVTNCAHDHHNVPLYYYA